MAERYVCPSCRSGEHLWRMIEIEGWEDIDDELRPISGTREMGYDADPTGQVGCAGCNWQGADRQLLKASELEEHELIRTRGQHPGQLKIPEEG